MLRTYSLGRCYLESGWVIHPLSGSLLKVDIADLASFQSKKIPKIVTDALIKCENPFLLNPPSDFLLNSCFIQSSAVKRNFHFFSSIKKINYANNEVKKFGPLEIKILKCGKIKVNNKIDDVAYMQVKDLTKNENEKVFIFNVWIFASDPSLTPFDHAIYDLQLLNCYNV